MLAIAVASCGYSNYLSTEPAISVTTLSAITIESTIAVVTIESTIAVAVIEPTVAVIESAIPIVPIVSSTFTMSVRAMAVVSVTDRLPWSACIAPIDTLSKSK